MKFQKEAGNWHHQDNTRVACESSSRLSNPDANALNEEDGDNVIGEASLKLNPDTSEVACAVACTSLLPLIFLSPRDLQYLC